MDISVDSREGKLHGLQSVAPGHQLDFLNQQDGRGGGGVESLQIGHQRRGCGDGAMS